jgi:hypothetical protein
LQTFDDLYTQQIQRLPATEQLRLAAMILQGLSAGEARSVDFYRDEWSDDDLADATIFSARQAAKSEGEE